MKRAISMYSFQDQYVTKKMNLEDIFRFLQENEAGLELLSDQMIRNSPRPSEETYRKWDALREKYPVALVCNDIFINFNLFPNRTLTQKESTAILTDELIMANRLGFPMVRLVSNTPPEVVEPALELAERLNVVMALEIHAGMGFDNPISMKFIDMIRRTGSDYVGLVVDTGIFCRRLPRIGANYHRHLGTSEDVIRYIDAIFESGTDPVHYFREKGGIPEDLQKLFKNPYDEEYAHLSETYENNPVSVLDDHMPYVKHIHGKVYEMTEEGIEYSIPFEEIVGYLKKAGYDGYIATEYEGNRVTLPGKPITEVEQVISHQEMLKRYLQN